MAIFLAIFFKMTTDILAVCGCKPDFIASSGVVYRFSLQVLEWIKEANNNRIISAVNVHLKEIKDSS